MHLISEQGSERATCDYGKVVTFNGKTHVVWQDVTRTGYLNRVRCYDHAADEWSGPVTLGTGRDNHARAVMTIDHEGYLHVILGGHGSPVDWCCSVKPQDSSRWTEPQTIAAGTYPVFICDRDNTLYLTVRHQAPGERALGVDLYAKPQDGPWVMRGRIIRRADEYYKTYAAYHMQMVVASGGTLHAVIDFYEGCDSHGGRGLHQAVCYAASDDGGLTWRRADGTPVKTPARPEDLDTFARSIEPRHEKLPRPEISQGGIVVDSHGRPYVLYLSHSERPGQLIFATVDEAGTWQRRTISVLEDTWPDMRVTECRAAMRSDDAICALITLTPLDDDWKDGKPTRAMHMKERADQRLAWLLSSDAGGSFSVRSVLEPGTTFNCPSVERSVGANIIPADRMPGILYFDGSQGYPGGGDYYDRSKTVAQILESGAFQQTRVFLTSLDSEV